MDEKKEETQDNDQEVNMSQIPKAEHSQPDGKDMNLNYCERAIKDTTCTDKVLQPTMPLNMKTLSNEILR